MIRIKNFILNSSYFQLEYEDEERLQFATREHSAIGKYYDAAGQQDIEEARRMSKLVNSQFPEVIATWDTCDEWITLYVDLKKEKCQVCHQHSINADKTYKVKISKSIPFLYE